MNKFWGFKNKKDEPSCGELTLYGDISNSSWFGDEITPKSFKNDLDALGDIKSLDIYINSGGGDVFAGQSIYSMLKRHSASKTVYIDGLAASIASVIAMAGDKIVMPSNAMMMIHKGWTMAIGNSNDLRNMADTMDKIDSSIAETYQQKSGKTKEEVLEIMDNDNKGTWYTASEAYAEGFIDEVLEEKKIAASIDKGFLNINTISVELKQFKDSHKLLDTYRGNISQPVVIKDETKLDLSEQRKQFNKTKLKLLEV